MSFKVKDYYYQKAKRENFVARSIYKLEEVDLKYKVINIGDQVIDLGYYPGSWVQYTTSKVGADGLVVGADIKPVNKKMLNIKNLRLFERDVFDIEELSELEVNKQFDVFLSDMAPNTTGIRSVDQDRSLNLVEKVFTLLPKFLRPNGNLVIKVFDSNQAQVFLKTQKKQFKNFSFLKPKSTRSVSKEFFVVGIGYIGNN